MQNICTVNKNVLHLHHTKENDMKTTIKEVFESWIITEIMQGCGGEVRVSAKRRYRVSDENNFFFGWCSEKYANVLAVENYGKKVNEFSTYRY